MNNHCDPSDMCHKSGDTNPVDMISLKDTTFE